MATNIGEIEVSVVARLDKLERDLKKLGKVTKKAADGVDKQTGRMAKGFVRVLAKVKGLVVAYAALSSAKMLLDQTKSVVSFGSAIIPTELQIEPRSLGQMETSIVQKLSE